ncbi:MAG: hypothetical protein ACFHU9_13605 [Fluviicola sp.]
MNRIIPITIILSLAITACSDDQTPKGIPFKLLPHGLREELEFELMEKLQQEVVEYHAEMNSFHNHDIMPVCGLEAEPRNLFEVNKTEDGDLFIEGESNTSGNIEGLVFAFYFNNESLSSKETIRYIRDSQYKYYDSPFYSVIGKKEIKQKIRQNELEIESAIERNEPDFVQFYQELLDDWKQKLMIAEALEVDELREIHPHIEIRIKDEASESGLSPLTINTLKALLEIRDHAARKYFQVSYRDLYFQSTRYYDTKADNRMKAIDLLFPVRIIDKSYTDRNDLKTSWVEAIPPPEEIYF